MPKPIQRVKFKKAFVGMVVVVSTSSLCCGFAFAFDLAATTLTLVCGT